MRKMLLFVLPILLLGLGACQGIVAGSSNLATQARIVSGINAVRLMTSGDLTITQGTQESLSITADLGIISLLTSTVTDGTLELSVQSLSGISTTLPITYNLVVKDLKSITLMGSGDINAAQLTGDKVSVTSMGSGDTKIGQLTSGILSVTIEGSGDVNVTSGTADDAAIRVAGSGNFNAGNLKLGKATLDILGSGDSEVWATNTLNVNILGSGSVRYYGNPSLQQSTLGSGDVISLGNK